MSRQLSLRVYHNHGAPNTSAFFTLRNGDGLSLFSGVVKFYALPRLTQMVFASRRARNIYTGERHGE